MQLDILWIYFFFLSIKRWPHSVALFHYQNGEKLLQYKVYYETTHLHKKCNFLFLGPDPTSLKVQVQMRILAICRVSSSSSVGNVTLIQFVRKGRDGQVRLCCCSQVDLLAQTQRSTGQHFGPVRCRGRGFNENLSSLKKIVAMNI